MKISVNDIELLTLSEIQCQVICNDIPEDMLDEDMKRRVSYVITHKYEQCFNRLKEEWTPKLESRMDSIPTNPEKFADLVFSQPDYQDRKKRDEVLATL